MSKVYVKLNRKGVGELLKSSEMHALIDGIASGVQSRAGNGYEMQSGETSQRAKAFICAATFVARRENAKNNTLLKALGGGMR